MMFRKIGCKGFSLVELMIGVLILTVILVPLLHAFLTSQKTADKAREIRSQTLAAQNVIETYSATDIGALLDKVRSSQTPLGGVAASAEIYAYDGAADSYELVTETSGDDGGAPGYEIRLTGIAAGTKTYDAVLRLDAAIGGSSKYAQVNSAEIVDYKPMDAVYIQPDPVQDAGNNPDIIASRIFAAQAQIDSGEEIPDGYFLDRMAREITITIDKLGGETGVVSCTALFQYETSFTYAVTDESTTPPLVTTYTQPYSTELNNDFYSGDSQDGGFGLYFFFYPNSAAQSDGIKILNRDNVDLSIYLIRQSAGDGGYNPAVELWENNMSAFDPQHATVHYNNIAIPQYPYKYYYKDTTWYRTNYFDSFLVDTTRQNRMYGVTVDLYKAGAALEDFPPEDMLASFGASSLE